MRLETGRGERMHRLRARWWGWAMVALAVSLVRIGAFAFLEYRAITGTETLTALPLVLLLYPEGLIVIPRAHPVVFTVLLLGGSTAMTVVMAALVTAFGHLREMVCRDTGR